MFAQDQVAALLAQCHRRCCICHRFCGVKMETDHIVPKAEAGTDDIENAIPVCFECHAEIHSYNDQHPRGRKFRPEELRRHKDEWLRVCREKPETLVAAPRSIDVGPLQALVDELEFNTRVAANPGSDILGCPFRDDQFKRAIQAGSVAILVDDVKGVLVDAYVAMGAANNLIQAVWHHPKGSESWANGINAASAKIIAAQPKVATAVVALNRFLRTE
jgi:hypothetical protein